MVKSFLKKNKLIYSLIIYIKSVFFRFVISKKFKKEYLLKGSKLTRIQGVIKNSNTFFGYYNIVPENVNGDILLCAVNTDAERGSLSSVCEISKSNLYNKNLERLTTTASWNWQQGCMLQWLGKSNNKIIYNNYNDNEDKYYSEIFDINTHSKYQLKKPIYTIDHQGRNALTINFDNLTKLRPDYGYFNKKKIDTIDYNNDGILNLDIFNNTVSLVFSFNNIINFNNHESMYGSEHKINHLDFSPNGKRFMFLHRWYNNSRKYTRLLTANVDGSEICQLSSNNMVSHCIWKNDDEILAFSEEDSIRGYHIYTDKSNKIRTFAENILTEDGHPSFSADGKWLITDTYPDRARFSRLILYNIEKNKKIILGEFHQSIKYRKERRCDLHPRWLKTEGFVSFDSCHSKRRQLYVMDIRKLLKI